MYAEYQQYQQQHQAANSFSSVNSSWNANSAAYSVYQTAQTSLPPNPVERYTRFYNGWNAHGTECGRQLQMIPMSNAQARKEMQQRVDWATYYSDLSARAAHHFYRNPNATSAPFDLPPEPPASTLQQNTQTSSNIQSNQCQQPKIQPTHNQQKTTDNEQAPGSLATYLKTCLGRCSTQEQKKAVQAVIEKKIADAIQQGVLHTKNWTSEPLVPVPGVPEAQSLPQPQVQRFQNFSMPISKRDQQVNYSHHSNYYGSSAINSSFSNTSGEGYYGPASSSRISNPINSYFNRDDDESVSSFNTQNKRRSPGNDDFIPLSAKAKKVKHSDLNGFVASNEALTKRANRFSGQGGIYDASHASQKVSIAGHDKYMGKGFIGGSSATLDEEDFERMTVKGTCTTLEKEYLRLTAPPKAELVRPENILKQHVENLKRMYNNQERKEYLWFCSQLKAVRQDCTVQRIQNEFAVDVYETHARIALQEGDLNEYNQCQTQLKELYRENPSRPNHEEFIAYRLLYYIVLSCNDQYDGGSSDMLKIMLSLSHEQRGHHAVSHALKVREAMALGDYISFFRLYEHTPNLGKHLMSLIVPTMRMRGLRRMAKAYRPTVGTEVCIRHLGFSSPDEGKEWLVSCGCIIDGDKIVTKDSVICEPEEGKKNSLI